MDLLVQYQESIIKKQYVLTEFNIILMGGVPALQGTAITSPKKIWGRKKFLLRPLTADIL